MSTDQQRMTPLPEVIEILDTLASDPKQFRKNAGLTLRQVEEKTGITNAYLSQLENGKIKRPSYDVLRKLYVLYSIEYRQGLECFESLGKDLRATKEKRTSKVSSFLESFKVL